MSSLLVSGNNKPLLKKTLILVYVLVKYMNLLTHDIMSIRMEITFIIRPDFYRMKPIPKMEYHAVLVNNGNHRNLKRADKSGGSVKMTLIYHKEPIGKKLLMVKILNLLEMLK